MTDHLVDEEQRHQLSSIACASTGNVRISPRQLLQSLSTFRIERTRIKPLEAKSCGAGRNADVVRARLEPAESSTSSHTETQDVAVKKMRVDDDIGDTPVLMPMKSIF
ncbi:hypothetical protein M407DRAFT_23607 [Tulasnella calospora MUT 4182]|uniref:Uncharacterized protein n=1 Tax=Tulasnella calospora MUT 4182 TaxID=1051891 RepID=A0A0C3QAC9_9AGAM|nr:hypothetical protein M407DRAFT_23607 [Tulasnella calospora MUT 4182]